MPLEVADLNSPTVAINCDNQKIEKLVLRTLDRKNITKWRANVKFLRTYSKSS